MGWYVGLDVGSYSCKAALLHEETFFGSAVVPSGTDYAGAARRALSVLLESAGLALHDVDRVVATGVGAKRIDFASSVAGEVITAARGAFVLAPSVGTLIDVGAQATRVVWLDEVGRVTHFASNEKCATGSGRFLQVIANVLRLPLEELGPLSLRATRPAGFTTGCAVFGESEAITRVSEGVAKEDIVAGVHQALAGKVASLMRVRGVRGTCALCGGGALDVGLRAWLERELGTELFVPERPRVVGALGASVQGRREALEEETKPVGAPRRVVVAGRSGDGIGPPRGGVTP